MPRPSRLTPEIQDQIVAYVRDGNYFAVACQLAGIPEETGRGWLSQGKGTKPGRKPKEPFATFATAIKEAEAEAEQRAIAVIVEAARGKEYSITKTKEVEVTGGESGLVSTVETVTTTGTKFSWQAAAWYLERKFPHRWGRQRMDVLEALRCLSDAGFIPVELVEMAAHEMGSVRARIESAFRQSSGIQGKPPEPFPIDEFIHPDTLDHLDSDRRPPDPAP